MTRPDFDRRGRKPGAFEIAAQWRRYFGERDRPSTSCIVIVGLLLGWVLGDILRAMGLIP